jgi:hypothetical protein
MSFTALVFIILAAVLVALVALGLWGRRRPQEIWNKYRLRAWARRSAIEREDVEEILHEHPKGFDGQRRPRPENDERES